MKLTHLIAVLSITLTTPLAANEVVKGVAIPLDYTVLYLMDEKSIDPETNEISEKPYLVRLIGVKSASHVDNEMQSWAIMIDLVQLDSDNPDKVSCQMFDNTYYGNNDSGICSINGKSLRLSFQIKIFKGADNETIFTRNFNFHIFTDVRSSIC